MEQTILPFSMILKLVSLVKTEDLLVKEQWDPLMKYMRRHVH